ncbi:MAG: hypothetical protein LUI06_01130 [Ruminococcus sp.]|nr:hypothetical protein [Ruminococcus sp.]
MIRVIKKTQVVIACLIFVFLAVSCGKSDAADTYESDSSSKITEEQGVSGESDYLLVSEIRESANEDNYFYNSKINVYEMDENGVVTLCASKYASLYNSEYGNSLSRYEYDAEGCIERENIYDSCKLSSYYLYDYSGGQLSTLSRYYYLEGQDDYLFCSQSYDESGEISEYTYYGSDEEITSQVQYEYTVDEYDENGNATKLTCYCDDTVASYITREYMTGEEYFETVQENGCESYNDLAEEIVKSYATLDAEKLLGLIYSEYLDAIVEKNNTSYEDLVEGVYIEDLRDPIENLLDNTQISDYSVKITSEEWLEDEEADEEIERQFGQYPRAEIEQMGRLSLDMTFISDDTATLTESFYVAKIDGEWYFLGSWSRSSDEAATDAS